MGLCNPSVEGQTLPNMSVFHSSKRIMLYQGLDTVGSQFRILFYFKLSMKPIGIRSILDNHIYQSTDSF